MIGAGLRHGKCDKRTEQSGGKRQTSAKNSRPSDFHDGDIVAKDLGNVVWCRFFDHTTEGFRTQCWVSGRSAMTTESRTA